MRRQLILVSLLSLILVTNAAADPQTTSRLHWVTDGNVQAAVQVGNTLYIGGTFTRVAPASNTLGSFYGLAAASGDPVPGFPLVDGVVNAIAPDGAGGYYIGGEFTMVGTTPRTNLAHVLSDGSVDPAFAATITGGLGTPPRTPAVTTLALGASLLFVAGDFATVNGESRARFAALNPTTGVAMAWPSGIVDTAPSRILFSGANVILVDRKVLVFDQATGAPVWSTELDVSPNGSVRDAVIAGTRLIVAGSLATGPLIALDVATGSVETTWAPSGPLPRANAVTSLAAFGTTLYVGGTFSTFGGTPRANAAAVDIPTATLTAWAPNPNAQVTTLATSPGGTVFLVGTFTQVGGASRNGLAEVDGVGNASPWIANASVAKVSTVNVNAGTVLVGGSMAITGGSARTKLAAFNLSTDELLPWAPVMADEVTELAAAAGSIFIGTSHVDAGPPVSIVNAVTAVDASSGATLPWTPPPTPPDAPGQGPQLLGVWGSYVYLSGAFSGPGWLIRVDATTAAIDTGWRPAIPGPSAAVVDGDTMYLAAQFRLWSLDMASGTVSAWNPPLPGATPSSPTSVTSMAISGRTLYASYYRLEANGSAFVGVQAFDTVTGVSVAGGYFGGGENVAAIGVADGQVIVGFDASVVLGFHEPLAAGHAVMALGPNGGATSWFPGFSPVVGRFEFGGSPGILVTATDVVLFGYERGGADPLHGIAVLPRTPSPAPTGLRGATVDNTVTLNWQAPAIPPTGYVLDVGTTLDTVALSLPTGSAAPSVTGLAGNGTYFVRARAAEAAPGPTSLPTNQIALVVGCTAPPAVPTRLAAQMNGAQVTLSWNASLFSSPTNYVIEGGASAGASTISATVPGTLTTISSPVPPGTYFARVHAANACGESAASGEVFFTVGSPEIILSAPTGLAANVGPSTVGIQWTPSSGALGYQLEVGTAPGMSDLATLPVEGTTVFAGGVPAGNYYARVRALNAAGLSAASAEVVISVTP